MKVKCKKIIAERPNRKDLGEKTDDLTVNKEYIVLSVSLIMNSLIYYRIETDIGDLVLFEADQFDVTSSYIPSSWEIKVELNSDESYYLNLAPEKWNHAPFSFYEEITEVSWPLYQWRDLDEIPEVVSLYFQERDLIYREQEEYDKSMKGGK